jgi:hypothetical protein
MDQTSPKMLTSWSGVTSSTTERVFSFAGLTLSDLRKSLLEGTLEGIMCIPLGRGDLHITHPELCEYDSISVSCVVSIQVHSF